MIDFKQVRDELDIFLNTWVKWQEIRVEIKVSQITTTTITTVTTIGAFIGITVRLIFRFGTNRQNQTPAWIIDFK